MVYGGLRCGTSKHTSGICTEGRSELYSTGMENFFSSAFFTSLFFKAAAFARASRLSCACSFSLCWCVCDKGRHGHH